MRLDAADRDRTCTDLSNVRRHRKQVLRASHRHYRIINDFDGHGLWDDETDFFRPPRDENEALTELEVRSNRWGCSAVCDRHSAYGTHRSSSGLSPAYGFVSQAEASSGRCVVVADCADPEIEGAYFIELVPKHRLLRLLTRVLDESEYFSDHGVCSLSRYHQSPV